jgi:Large extracellular alpha-helical protein
MKPNCFSCFAKTALLSVVVAFAVCFSSCGNGRKSKESTYLEEINAVDSSLLGIVDLYTSGLISAGEPLQIRFFEGIPLKKQFGEVLSPKLFSILPKLKGEAYWIDNRTIGFRFDENAVGDQAYKVEFKVSEFVDVPDVRNLSFGFAVRKQQMNIEKTTVEYLGDEATLTAFLNFANPINAEQALSLLSDSERKMYGVKAQNLSANQAVLTFSSVPVKKNPYTLNIILNGKEIGIDKQIEHPVNIRGNETFEVVGTDVDRINKVLTIYFNRLLDNSQSLEGFFSFSDELAYTAEISGSKIMLYFDKTKNDIYYEQYAESEGLNLELSMNVKDENGNRLSENFKLRDIVLVDLKPKVRWSNEGNIIPGGQDVTVYFDAVCLNSVVLRVIRIYNDNLLGFLQDNNTGGVYGVRKVGRLEKKVKINLDQMNISTWKTYPIVLSDYVNVKPGDIFQLSLDFDRSCYPFACENGQPATDISKTDETAYWNGDSYDYKQYFYNDWKHSDDPCYASYYNYVEQTKNVFVSELALMAKKGDDNMVTVFARNISDASPVSNAVVSLYNYQMQLVGQGKTDASGYAKVAFGTDPYFVMLTGKEKDRSFLKLDKSLSLSYSKFDVSGTALSKNIKGFVYSNRDVWRPGDEMQLNLMLCDADGKIPENYPVIMELYDASGKLYERQSNITPKDGIYCYVAKTDPKDVTGFWKVDFKVANSTFSKMLRVETIKPNRLEINLDLPKIIDLTKPASAKLSAKWLSGQPASGLSASVSAKLRPCPVSFEHFPQYTFVGELREDKNQEVEVFSAPLGADGAKTVSFAPFASIASNGFLKATFVTKVFEQGGDFSISTQQTIVSPFHRFVGVSLPDAKSEYGQYYFTNQDWTFDVAVVKTDGKLEVENVTLDYALYKLDSYWWWSAADGDDLSRYTTGAYKNQYKQGTLNCNQGKAALKINIPEKDWGSYLLMITDAKGGNVFVKQLIFDWSDSKLHSGASGDAPELLALRTDKEKYSVGEKAKVYFPANQEAKAIVTLESSGRILKEMVYDKLDKDAMVEFELTEQMRPNVYVYVSLIQPYHASNDLPIRMYGVVPVIVESESALLKPVLSVPETSNSQKKVFIKVAEANKKPMTYTLAVVDEGLLGLTNYNTPDPYRFFNQKQALGIRTWDNYNDIIDVYTGEIGTVYAVGGDGTVINLETMLDKRFKAIAKTYGPFSITAGETKSHDFDIPEYNGSLRVMVVASGENASFGSAQANIKVKDPIALLATAPRVLSPNDEVVLNVQIMAPDKKGETLTLKVNNESLIAMEEPAQTVKLDKKGEALVKMKARVAETTDAAVFEVEVSDGKYTAKSRTEIPIRLPFAVKHKVIQKEIPAKTTENITFDMEGLPSSFDAKLSATSLIPIDLFSRLDFLMTYPHGCLEQLTSKAFSQLYLDYFVDLGETSKSEMKKNVESTIARLRSYLRSDNSLTNWAGGNYVEPWTEIYALHFLIEAEKQGYAVPSDMLKGMIAYQAKRAKQWNYSVDDPSGETIQAYRLLVLALHGNQEVGAMNRFKELDLKYTLSKALLAASYATIGKTKTAQELMPILRPSEIMSNYNTSYGSSTRDLAFSAYTMMLCGKDKKVVQSYMDDLANVLTKDECFDTQTTSFALFALGKYAEKMKDSNGAISLMATANGVDKTLSTNKNMLSFDFIPKQGGNTVKVKNTSDRKLIVSVYTKSVVPEYEMEESGAWYTMSVIYKNSNGEVIDPSSLSAGTDFYAEIKVANPNRYQVTENALSYLIPSGWQIINDRLSAGNENLNKCKFVDYRDDRVYFYFDLEPYSEMTFKVSLNASFEGEYMVPAIRCEDMYNDEIYYVIPSKPVMVK